jgi:molybdopterin-guanine dinucleotide biosynthesis protein A
MADPRVTAVVLAGGRSTRFGRDKLAAEISGGGTLLDRAVAALAEVADEIVIVGAAGASPPAVTRVAAPLRIVHDPHADGGPLVGLAAGLEAARGEIAVVAAGDMPALVPDVLRLLIDEVASGAAASALEEGGRRRPLPCALDRTTAIEAAQSLLAAGGSSLTALLAALDAVVVPADDWRALDPDGRSLLDVDRPSDLDALPDLGRP